MRVNFKLAVIVAAFGVVAAPNAAVAQIWGHVFPVLTIGEGGLTAFNWEINDAGPSPAFPVAAGVGGPTPNANNQVVGWMQDQANVISQGGGRPHSTGDVVWTAESTVGNQFDLDLSTLLSPTTVGLPDPGPMSDFDPSQRYVWPIIMYQGTYVGPTDSATLTADTLFDTSDFLNAIAPGATFTLALVQNPAGGGAIDIVYTPTAVPEPGALALTGMAAIGWVTFWRRRWRR